MKIIPMIMILFLLPLVGLAGTGDTSWMTKGNYGIFMHYQYRILLNYSAKTDPQYPNPPQMTAEEWNRFVDGFDVDCIELDTYKDVPDDWWKINSIVRAANPRAVIAFSYGSNEFGCVKSGIDDYTAGDMAESAVLCFMVGKNDKNRYGWDW